MRRFSWINIVLTFLMLTAGSGFAQKLKIEIFNKTGYDIDSISFCEKDNFKLKKEESIILTGCESISMQEGMLATSPPGVVLGMTRRMNFWECGNGVVSVDKGNFRYDIKITGDRDGYFLVWGYHD